MKKAEMNFEITKYSDITEMTIFADGKDIGGYIAEPDKTYLSIRTFNDKGSANGHKFYKSKSGMNKALANFGLTLDEVKAKFEKLTGESAANEIIADCVDEYFVDTDAAAEVEIKNAEIAKAVSAKLDEIYAWDKFTMTIDDAVNAATDEITLTNQRGHVETFRKVKHGITSDIFFHVERTVNGKGFEVGCCFATMAVYEKPEQVADVLLKLAEDVKSGKTEFVFPTQEEYDAKLAAFENRRRDIRNLRDTQKMIRKCISAGDIDSAESLFSYAGALLREIRQAA